MRLCLITNPGAGTSEAFHALRDVLDQVDAEVRQTACEGDAAHIAERAAAEGFDAVVACGGDGTVHEVVNGLMRVPQGQRPTLGVLPFGTGNDLARSLALPADPRQALALVTSGVTHPLDVLHVRPTGGDSGRYAVNMVAGGFAGAVSEAVAEQGLKQQWGPLGYLVGAARVLVKHQASTLTLTLDGTAHTLDALNVFVANGRYVAAGTLVSADAHAGDGWLDVVTFRDGTTAELTALAALHALGRTHESPLVAHFRARTVELHATPEMRFNADGELLDAMPSSISVLPGALRVSTGPAYMDPQPDRVA